MYLNSRLNLFNASKCPNDLFLDDGLTDFVKYKVPKKIEKKKPLKTFRITWINMQQYSFPGCRFEF